MSDVTLIHVRDPDGGCDIRVFLDGVEVEHGEFTVDAGRGYDQEDWEESQEFDIAAAAKVSPAVVDAVRQAYDDPPGSKYIT